MSPRDGWAPPHPCAQAPALLSFLPATEQATAFQMYHCGLFLVATHPTPTLVIKWLF